MPGRRAFVQPRGRTPVGGPRRGPGPTGDPAVRHGPSVPPYQERGGDFAVRHVLGRWPSEAEGRRLLLLSSGPPGSGYGLTTVQRNVLTAGYPHFEATRPRTSPPPRRGRRPPWLSIAPDTAAAGLHPTARKPAPSPTAASAESPACGLRRGQAKADSPAASKLPGRCDRRRQCLAQRQRRLATWTGAHP
jgi:hypothetical protein